MARRFDRIMVAQRLCQSRTSRRLNDGEFRAFIAALCLAGQSPVRGSLLLSAGVPLTAGDVGDEAGVDEDVAAAALEKLQQLGTLVEDKRQGCLRFEKWADFNPAPRPSDSAEATRERKRRQRARQRAEKAKQEAASGRVSGNGQPSLPAPPTTGRKRDRDRYAKARDAAARALFPGAFEKGTAQRIARRAADAIERAQNQDGADDAAGVLAWVEKHSPDLLEYR